MKILKILLIACIAGLILLAGSFFWSKRQIKKSLVETGTAAAEKYNCPAREALIVQMQDTTIDVRTMNRTVWAIGKLKVTESVPLLEDKYIKWAKASHKYNKSRYEVEKALGYMKQGKLDLMSFDGLKFN
ncbi:MAG: hypothetical protein K9H26_12020 [Prolixibacteraceae bacterium]|nr:hypothetical protein [Prolixibacteraceae bacterium]